MGPLPALLVLSWAASSVSPAELPPPPARWVTDGAGVLSSGTEASLDARLAAYERESGHQVLVWIGGSIGTADLETWAARTFESWRVGRAGLDDGVVLFILMQDRRARIEVGYGLEPVLTDALSGRILDEALIPRLRAGDPDGAVSASVEAILRAIGGEVPFVPSRGPPQAVGSPVRSIGFWVMVAIMLILFIRNPALAMMFLSTMRSGRHGGGFGGGFGGGGDGGFHGGGGRSGGGGASRSW